MHNLIILGRPGSGKGTQAEILAKKFQIPHISSGEIFRDNIENNTPLGIKSKGYVNSGGLVPDDILLEMLKERMQQEDTKNGYILEGTPRTLFQGEEIQKMFFEIRREITKVIYLFLSREEMMKRISGRWTCKANDHIYHELYNPPKISGVCDVDGSELYQREDQQPEAVLERIRKFEMETEPLVDFYKNLGLLVQVNGEQSIEKVAEEILIQI